MGSHIRQRVTSVRARQQRLWMSKCLSWGMLLGGAVGCLLAGMIMAGGLPTANWPWVVGVLVGGPLLGLLWSVVSVRPLHGAAATIDRECGLKDRITTAWTFLAKPQATPVHELQISDADEHAASVDPRRVAPFRTPRSLPWGTVLSGAAIVMMLFAPQPEPLQAAVVNEAVVAQADKLAEELKELEEFNGEEPDPEIEQLLKELQQKIEELREPGMDPREAMAKLSEMQMALESQQESMKTPTVEAELKSIGEALSLAPPLESSGQALVSGDYEKAAAALEKQEMPDVDRQTVKAMTEKLDKLREQPSDGASRQLREAAQQISSGLSQGNKSSFEEGMKSLAGESKKQSRRTKLSDLLKKQCQCLSECKGECESLCQSQGLSRKKGGKKAGKAASGNEPGESTAPLSTAEVLQLTGQESAEGDVDVENVKSQEEKQQAVRDYQQKVQEYEQLSESVLDSEPIPLGHRQTIRRYFDSIRPQAEEVDAVNQATADDN